MRQEEFSITSNPILKNFLRNGGIRLRLTLIFSILFLILTIILSGIIITIQGNALRDKSQEVCKVIEIGLNATSRESIATSNLITLQDVLKTIKKADISGLVRVEVYSINRKKSLEPTSQFSIVASTDEAKIGKSPIVGIEQLISESREKKDLRITESKNEANENVLIYSKPVFISIAGQEKWIGLIYIEYLESAINQASRQAVLISTLVSLLTLIVAILVIYRIGGNISSPIRQIASASRQVGNGDFSIQLDIQTNDELEELSNEFNSMVKGLNDKAKMEKFVSKSTVDMIQGSSLKDEIVLGGKKEEIAFLFSDVRGFTAMSEKKTPEEVVKILNHYLDLQSIVIKENGGDIDKYVGDEIMAVFHGPDKRYLAIKSAVEIIEAVRKQNEERMHRGEDTINVGVGLNVGEVVVGSMGSRFRMDYTCIGDAVNLAARLCSAAEPGTVIASQGMLDGNKHESLFLAEPLAPVKVKGKEKPIQIYKMIRRKNGSI